MAMSKWRSSAVAVGAAALLVASATASIGITGGEEDSTNMFSSVGMIVFYDEGDGQRYRCSATLVEPDLLLTAAHCTFGTLGKTIVTFNWEIARQRPSGIPLAPDDAGTELDHVSETGYTLSQTLPAGYYIGQAVAHPDYSQFRDLDNWNDVGVVQLTQAVPGITPSTIAPMDYLEQFTPNVLGHTYFTVVGYGTEVRKPSSGPQTPTPQSYPLVRRYTDEVGQRLMPQILQTNGNENDARGGGGTCFGDSGGPSFHGGKITTVTSYGRTANCRYIAGLQRMDIPSVQCWLQHDIGMNLGLTPEQCAPASGNGKPGKGIGRDNGNAGGSGNGGDNGNAGGHGNGGDNGNAGGNGNGNAGGNSADAPGHTSNGASGKSA